MGDRVDYLFEPEGSELHWDGLKEKPSATQAMDRSVPGASLSGPSKVAKPMVVAYHPDERVGMRGTSPADRSPVKQHSPVDLMAQAHEMMAQTKANETMGPSLSERDDSGGQLPSWLVEEMKKNGQ
jgi:hypothetical protein